MNKLLGFSLKQKASRSSPSASSLLPDNLLLCTKLCSHFYFLVLVISFIQGSYSSAVFTLLNNCQFIVWPASDSPLGGRSGFALQTGEPKTVKAPSSWQGRIWGRTDCGENPDGYFTCITGGCTTKKIECAGGNATTAVTLLEFQLNVTSGMDIYDVSVADGFNLPISVVPWGGSGARCRSTGCVCDMNGACPPVMRLNNSDGKVVACQGACSAFGEAQYCCTGEYSSRDTCKPSQYSHAFKNLCPNAYTYPYDNDQDALFACTGADYNITFCPSPATRLPPSQGSPSSQGSPPNSPPSKGMKKHVRIILIVGSMIVLLILGIALFAMRKIKKGRREKKLNELLTLGDYAETHGLESGGAKNHDLRLFPYETILSATSNFSSDNKLGEGGFGSVYKGKTPEGQDIAVKLLSRQSGQGLLEFKTELMLISKLQHVNLVKLLGLCIHGDDKMIIYDYMPNKSLDFFLFSASMREQLNWQLRFNIIEGIAQGLLYLHKYSRLKIIHRDLKPSNILLAENMNAKISDFGLARVFEQNMEEANTNRRVGTYGYMAPEYAMQGIYSVKSDVYSFGVLILEIVSGQKNNCFHQIEGPLNLVEYAWELWRKDSAVELMDPTLRASCDINQLQRCIHIGLLCVENRALDRPSIEDVILMLKSETTSLPMPMNPSFIARNNVFEEAKRSTPDKLSINELTVSELGGR